MKFNLDSGKGTYKIEHIDSHSIIINKKVYTRNLIIMPESLNHWAVDSFENLEVTHFEQLCALHPAVVLLGTGASIRFPDPELLAPLINEGIGVEMMDTPAACRTYMILMAEGRKVAAALLIQ